MFNQYILPVIGLLGMIASFYFLRKTRDKKYSPSLIIFLIPFVIDIAVGVETHQPYWVIVIKVIVLTAGWLAWYNAYSTSHKQT